MGARQTVPISCRCGKVRGILEAGHGGNLVCHCADCRAADRHITGKAPVSPVPIYQTTPDRVRIDAGMEHIACIRLSPNGLRRWYASCCGTPLANTLATPALPFLGLAVAVVSPEARAALGPVIGEGFVPGRDGKVRHKGILRVAGGFLSRAIGSRLVGRERHAPFFQPDGTPIREAHILTPDERTLAYGKG